MHEQALLQDLGREVNAVAEREGEREVARVRVWIGALSHLTPEHLRAEWPDVVRGTRAERATLEVEVSRDPRHPQAQAVVLTSVSFPQGDR